MNIARLARAAAVASWRSTMQVSFVSFPSDHAADRACPRRTRTPLRFAHDCQVGLGSAGRGVAALLSSGSDSARRRARPGRARRATPTLAARRVGLACRAGRHRGWICGRVRVARSRPLDAQVDISRREWVHPPLRSLGAFKGRPPRSSEIKLVIAAASPETPTPPAIGLFFMMGVPPPIVIVPPTI